MTAKPTALELSVLRDVAAGQRKWITSEHPEVPKKDQQKLSRIAVRLLRKNLIRWASIGGYQPTEAGRAALGKED